MRCMAQTETFDAEMEGLASNVKKNKKLPARHGHLEESISRHKQHITRLEQMLRLLDNEVRKHPWNCRAKIMPAAALSQETLWNPAYKA